MNNLRDLIDSPYTVDYKELHIRLSNFFNKKVLSDIKIYVNHSFCKKERTSLRVNKVSPMLFMDSAYGDYLIKDAVSECSSSKKLSTYIKFEKKMIYQMKNPLIMRREIVSEIFFILESIYSNCNISEESSDFLFKKVLLMDIDIQNGNFIIPNSEEIKRIVDILKEIEFHNPFDSQNEIYTLIKTYAEEIEESHSLIPFLNIFQLMLFAEGEVAFYLDFAI